MNILVDYGGHSDLYYTMHALLEKRLGHQLYFPIGEDWIQHGYVTSHYPMPLEESAGETILDGIHLYHRKMEVDKGFFDMKGITFSKFLEMDFGMVVTTTYYQEKPFYNLVKNCKPQAIFLRQIANIHETTLGFCKNALLGAAYHPRDYENRPVQQTFVCKGVNNFVYIPEQYEGYTYTEPTNNKLIICLSRYIGPDDLVAWNQCKKELEPLGFTFKMYGYQYQPYEIDPIYGDSIPHPMLPQAIKDSTFVWYTKPHGGGGFTVREALACGRPVILRKKYSSTYGTVECELFKHGINCIDLDLINRKNKYDFSLLRSWTDADTYSRITKQTADHFQNDTQFENTANKIQIWFDSLPKGVLV